MKVKAKKVEAKKEISSKALTQSAHKTKGHVGAGVLTADEIKLIDYLKSRKDKKATIKQIAAEAFNGDYLKVKNLKRKPIKLGEIHICEPGVYKLGAS